MRYLIIIVGVMDVGGGVGDYVDGTAYIRDRHGYDIFFLPARHSPKKPIFFHDIGYPMSRHVGTLLGK